MPYSDWSNNEWFKWLINEIQPSSVIDVGPGAGKYGLLTREVSPSTHTTAVEIWGPYLSEFGLETIYDHVFICDARIYPNYKADLVILGDILEHMTKEDALALWTRIRLEAKAAVISIPIIHFPQGESSGNPYETHVEDHWTHEEILSTFPGITGHSIFEVTASYIAEFN